MSGEPNDLQESDPNGGGPDGLSGDMGVSSERVGRVRGQAEPVTHGTDDTSVTPRPEDGPPEQTAD